LCTRHSQSTINLCWC